MRLHEAHGEKWGMISQQMRGRSDLQCRYQFKRTTASRKVDWCSDEDLNLFAIVSLALSNHRHFQTSTTSTESSTTTSSTIIRNEEMNNVSWIEISKCLSKSHFTEIPRTALECRQRFSHLSNIHQ